MNLQQVVDGGNFSIFGRMGDDKRVRHIDIVRYIEHLASSTGIDISDWNILETFGKGVGNELHTNRREINRRFFNKYRQIQNENPPQAFTLEARIQEELDNAARQLVTQQIECAKIEHDNALSQAHRAYRRYLEQLAHAFERNQLIAGISRKTTDIGAQVKTIIQEGFWDYHSLEGTELTFITKNDVVCRHVNRSANIDIQVNLGKFRAIYDLRRGFVRVYGHENNIDLRSDNSRGTDGLVHPHVSSGDICWGRSGQTANRLMSQCELPELFRLLANLLMDYCDDNPYAHLYSFRDHKVRHTMRRFWRTGNYQVRDIVKLIMDAGADPHSFMHDPDIGFENPEVVEQAIHDVRAQVQATQNQEASDDES